MQEKLQFIIEGGSVVRFHSRPGLRPDTDAHHSHGVAMLCYLLGDKVQGPSTSLLMAALTHDLGEQKGGDIPSPTKRLLGLTEQHANIEERALEHYDLYFYEDLTQYEKQVLAWADMFDGMLYACREIALGNRMMVLVYKRYRSYVQSIFADLSPEAQLVYASIQKIYKEYRFEPKYDVFTATAD
jgi:5'-deoxynucleotidase YfbR-like HD superfamily hydrolase